MKLILLGFYIALTALGQSLEIRGNVIESGPNIPLPGVEVTLFAMTVDNQRTFTATTFSDSNGVYVFRPERLGLYRVEMRKTGYVTTQNTPNEVAAASTTLTSARPKVDLRSISLLRPGTLTGRIVDEDRKPVAGLEVYVQVEPGTTRASGRMAVTDDDGRFTAAGLIPRNYVVRIAPARLNALQVLDGSSEEVLAVDQDIEASQWPAAPVVVPGGATSDAGTITLRTVPYFRARVHFRGECAEGEQWQVALLKLPYVNRADEHRLGSSPCRSEFVVPDIAPGSYMLAVWTGEENTRWARTPLNLNFENVEATISFSPSSDLTAAVVIPSGVSEPSLGGVRVQLRAEDAPPAGGNTTAVLKTDRTFGFKNVPWQRQILTIQGLPRTHYIKEIRYSGQRAPDPVLSVSPGGHIEIVLDDHPATIKGKVIGLPPRQGPFVSAFVAIVREGYRTGTISGEPFEYMAPAGPDGDFQVTGLPPGDYRVRTQQRVSGSMLEVDEPVRVAAGETKTVEVRLR